MSKKQLLKTVAFLLIFVMLFGYVSSILCAKRLTPGGNTYIIDGFYDLKKDSVDVCFMGSSQTIFGINEMKIYEDYGISSYNMGTGDQPLLVTYYWLKEVDKRQDLTNVVLDVSMLYESEKETRFRRDIDAMPWSLNKIQAIMAHAGDEESESVLSYFINIIKYHTRWKELTREDFSYDDSRSFMYRGSYLASRVMKNALSYEKFIIDNDTVQEKEMEEGQKEWFLKIIQYCEENDINLLLIKTPKASWSMARHNGVQALADEYGLEFLDFNTDAMLKNMGFDFEQDMMDKEHLNIRGADKLSAYLAEYLLERYEFVDYRTVEGYNPGNLERYHKDYKDKYLQTSDDGDELFSFLKDSRYDVVIQSSEDVASGVTEQMQSYLTEMGVTADLTDAAGKNYILAINGGTCVSEQVSEESISYDGTFSNGVTYSAVGDLGRTAKDAAITINGEETQYTREGMNITVYDNEYGGVADMLTLYLKEGNLQIHHVR